MNMTMFKKAFELLKIQACGAGMMVFLLIACALASWSFEETVGHPGFVWFSLTGYFYVVLPKTLALFTRVAEDKCESFLLGVFSFSVGVLIFWTLRWGDWAHFTIAIVLTTIGATGFFSTAATVLRERCRKRNA